MAPTKQVDERAECIKGHEGMTARFSAPLLTFDLAAEIEQLNREEHWVKDGTDSGDAFRFQNRSVKRIYIALLILFSVASAAVSFGTITHVAAAFVPQKARNKTVRKSRPPTASPTSAISGGVRIKAVSIEAVGKSWGDDSEGSKLEAGEGEDILVVHLTFKSTPALRGQKEITFSNPELLLDEGRTGHTNLAGFKLLQDLRNQIDHEMDIPFVVPEGAEPLVLTLGDAALDLSSLPVTEPAEFDPSSLPRSERERLEGNKRDEEFRNKVRQQEADRKRFQEMHKQRKELEDPMFKPLLLPSIVNPALPDASPSPTPSASPSPASS